MVEKKSNSKKTREPLAIPKHDPIYVPILKGKAGEFKAVKNLSPEVRARLTPLFEIPPVSYDFINDRPAKSLSSHLKSVVKGLEDAVETVFPFYVDAELLTEDRLDDGTYVLDFLMTNFRAKNLQAIPVIRLGAVEPLLRGLKENGNINGKVCLRVDQENINTFDLNDEIARILNSLELSFEEADLVLDFGFLKNDQEPILSAFSKMTLNTFPEINRYSQVILAMTSFPENLSGQDAASVKKISRSEWNVWRAIADGAGIKRQPIFGDYSIANPSLLEMDPRILQMSANIRYTTEDSWVIIKGRGVRNNGFEQFYDLSKYLVEDSGEFYGPEFCWGDNQIQQKARGEGGTGSATTWRQIGTNHHLSAVVNQLNAIFHAS